MRILITGGAGFIGQIVTKHLLQDLANELILVDIIEPPIPQGVQHGGKAHSIEADLVDGVHDLVPNDLDAAILLHGVVGSHCERNQFLSAKYQ